MEASTETAATINGLPTHINILSKNTFADFSTTTNTGFGILTSTTFAGFEVLTSTTQSGFASVNTGLNDLSSATISGFNILTIKTAHASFGFNKAEPKVEEAKGIEYYILDDRLAEKIDATRIQTLERDDYFEIVVSNKLVLNVSWHADNSRVARVWHMDIGALNNGIENS